MNCFFSLGKRQQVKKNYDENGQEVQSNEQTIEIVANDEQMDSKINSHDNEDYAVESVSASGTVFLLVILLYVSGLSDGVIPAIQSYACIPYSYHIYHLTLTLSNIANPVTCFVFPFIRTTSTVIIAVRSCIYFGMCSYILIVASQSPNALLRCGDSGAAFIVGTSYIITVLSYIYSQGSNPY